MEQLRPKLVQESLELKEARGSEPDGLVLQAIVRQVCLEYGNDFSYIKFSTLSGYIWEHHRVPLQPRQIGPIARELGFETKISHGATVVVPTTPALLKACEDCEYTDEAVQELKQQLWSFDGKKQP
jgi:hypothetical protein